MQKPEEEGVCCEIICPRNGIIYTHEVSVTLRHRGKLDGASILDKELQATKDSESKGNVLLPREENNSYLIPSSWP